MANYDNLENEQIESFDGDYGRRLLSVSRPSKIVTPLRFNNGRNFNAAKAIKSNERRINKELPPEAEQSQVDNEMPKEDIGTKVKEKAVDIASKKLPPGLQGIGKNAMNNLLSGGNSSKVNQTIFKAQKMKLYLIAGCIFFGLLLFIAIIFAVSSTGGTEASGAGFNEVSEYELEDDDSIINDETTEQQQ